jgi:hypothetical protein
MSGWKASAITSTGVAMAARQPMPKQGRSFAAGAAILVLVAWHAEPATASSNMPVSCDDVAAVSFEVPASDLNAAVVNHEVDAKGIKDAESAEKTDALSPDHYLAPRVESVLREVFKDSATPIVDRDKQPAMNTRVPGVSDDELARYKRQMYRTDI